jgi:hypothetical protein
MKTKGGDTGLATELPDTPAGRELEDFFAALLQSTGHYVEKNIEEPNILELDIVATDYRAGAARSRLFEVKGTNARLEDIFKLVGRMRYLGIQEGAFVTTGQPRDRETEWFRGVCERCNVRFVMVPAIPAAPQVFEEHAFGRAEALAHAVWRYSFWIERILVRTVRDMRRTVMAARAANDYHMLVNSGVFLTPDPVEKVAKLYAAYQEHPRLTAELAEEMAGDWERGQALLRQALLTSRHPALHAALYFEHRGRLSILKAAADYLLQGGPVDATDPNNIRVNFGLVDLPQTFLGGLDWLGSQPKYWLFPLFWQNYLWGWGGLLPDQHRERVLGDIATASGLSPAEAESALQALDHLFPIDGGWHRHFENADYQFVVLTPAPFQGLGAFHQLRRAGVETYHDYVPTGQYTESDFVRRHNATVALIESANERDKAQDA